MSTIPLPSAEAMRCGILEWLGAVTTSGTVLLTRATSHEQAGYTRHPVRFRIAHDSGDVFWTATLEHDQPEAVKEAVRAKASRKGITLSERWRSSCAEVMVEMQEQNQRFFAQLAKAATQVGGAEAEALREWAKGKIKPAPDHTTRTSE